MLRKLDTLCPQQSCIDICADVHIGMDGNIHIGMHLAVCKDNVGRSYDHHDNAIVHKNYDAWPSLANQVLHGHCDVGTVGLVVDDGSNAKH